MSTPSGITSATAACTSGRMASVRAYCRLSAAKSRTEGREKPLLPLRLGAGGKLPRRAGRHRKPLPVQRQRATRRLWAGVVCIWGKVV